MCVVGIVLSPRRDAGARFNISPAGVPLCRSKVRKGWYCCWRERNQNASLDDWRLY